MNGSGYDRPVEGLEDGNFLLIHCTAITCLVVSLLCAITTLVLTVRAHQWKLATFYSWTTGDRVLVYMAVTDGLFNLMHMLDHGLYLAQRDHVRPPQLCAFFGFVLSVFVIAQNALVCFVALEACLMVFRLRPPNFGRRDWRPMAVSLGPGLLFSGALWVLDQLGPSGAFCYLDPVKAPVALLVFTTLFLVGVGVFNLAFYAVTVVKLHIADLDIRRHLGSRTDLSRSVNKTAWTCTYFVLSFFAQWLPIIVYGAWSMSSERPPFGLFMAITTFTNLGGLFNLLLFAYIRLKKRRALALSRQNAVRKRRALPTSGLRRQSTEPSPHGGTGLKRLHEDAADSDTLVSTACSTARLGTMV